MLPELRLVSISVADGPPAEDTDDGVRDAVVHNYNLKTKTKNSRFGSFLTFWSSEHREVENTLNFKLFIKLSSII